jgi:hypothetical protein
MLRALRKSGKVGSFENGGMARIQPFSNRLNDFYGGSWMTISMEVAG